MMIKVLVVMTMIVVVIKRIMIMKTVIPSLAISIVAIDFID